ncbi:MAG: polyphosphate polymerase domain-containing protein [Lachnospiraceae bacterium]|nr:polyphosphate polymerase domain-containing protein [Lachnospiraceae bacterium]
MKYRHELKHDITIADMMAIRARLRAVMKPDPHAIDGKYFIRSLYFDTPGNKALREKQDGINKRQKFRIRYYNGNKETIHLEKKCKDGGLGLKVATNLTEDEAGRIARGDIAWMETSEDELIKEFHYKIRTEGLAPKVIVDYTREPFVYGPGNVRVTLDYDIRTGLDCTDFMNINCITIPAAPGRCIMEVKWDEYLPDIVRDAVRLPHVQTGSFSKYEACRIPFMGYGFGEL